MILAINLQYLPATRLIELTLRAFISGGRVGKTIWLATVVFGVFGVHRLMAQIPNESKGLEIIDITGDQLRIMRLAATQPAATRDSILLDSLYRPYRVPWSGYIGGPAEFLAWADAVNGDALARYNARSRLVDAEQLQAYLIASAAAMEDLTGFRPAGQWYFFFGPERTNIGGFRDGTMLVDLAHMDNAGVEEIAKFLPHQLNHQVYANTMPISGNTVLHRILDEGFASYVSYLYHDGELSPAEALGYEDEAFRYCVENEASLLRVMEKYAAEGPALTEGPEYVNGLHMNEDFPGALGYYIGFRIVEEYVKRHGPDSWKQLYLLQPADALEQSGLRELHEH